MRVCLGVEVLAVLAGVLLVSSVTEGAVVDKCVLWDKLNSSISNLTNLEEVAKIVCHVNLTSGFNTDVVNPFSAHSGKAHEGRPSGQQHNSTMSNHNDQNENSHSHSKPFGDHHRDARAVEFGKPHSAQSGNDNKEHPSGEEHNSTKSNHKDDNSHHSKPGPHPTRVARSVSLSNTHPTHKGNENEHHPSDKEHNPTQSNHKDEKSHHSKPGPHPTRVARDVPSANHHSAQTGKSHDWQPSEQEDNSNKINQNNNHNSNPPSKPSGDHPRAARGIGFMKLSSSYDPLHQSEADVIPAHIKPSSEPHGTQEPIKSSRGPNNFPHPGGFKTSEPSNKPSHSHEGPSNQPTRPQYEQRNSSFPRFFNSSEQPGKPFHPPTRPSYLPKNFSQSGSFKPSHETIKPSHETIKPSHATIKLSHETIKPSHETIKPSHETIKPSHVPINSHQSSDAPPAAGGRHKRSFEKNQHFPSEHQNNQHSGSGFHPSNQTGHNGHSAEEGDYRPSHSESTQGEKNKKLEGQWMLYGVFQLSDHVACVSGSIPTLNLCGVPCNNFLDDDITDDTECVNTIITHGKSAGSVKGENDWAIQVMYEMLVNSHPCANAVNPGC